MRKSKRSFIESVNGISKFKKLNQIEEVPDLGKEIDKEKNKENEKENANAKGIETENVKEIGKKRGLVKEAEHVVEKE